MGQEHDFRYSFCCSECRRRTTPPSARFLGRRVYLGALVVLATVLMQGLAPWRISKLQQLLGVSRRTLGRWRRWWAERFASTRWWLVKRAALVPPVDDVPRGLLDRFVGEPSERLVALLRWLSDGAGHAF